jgi:quercetin dioxygenase-like cupin family protein
MIKKGYQEVQKEKVTKANSTNTKVRWLITKEDGPTHFATRRFEIDSGGQIGIHKHKEEHHIYVLSGKASFLNGKGHNTPVGKDNVVYIPPNEEHGIKNDSDKPFVFICIIPYLRT